MIAEILFAIIIIFFFIQFRKTRIIELEDKLENMIDKKYIYNNKIYSVKKI
jgi:hypothetical protein